MSDNTESILAQAGETARVQTRDIIADITQPISFLRAGFSHMAAEFARGNMFASFSSIFKHGATLMLEECKANCPVDTGNLRDSLYVTTEDQSGEQHEAGHTKMDRHFAGHVGSLSVRNTFAYITTDVHYAYFLEYGTSKMPAHPFMRPAMDSSAGSTTAWIGDFIATHLISGLLTGGAGTIAMFGIDLGDIVLAHAGHSKQKHGLVRDAAGRTLEYAGARLVGGAARKVTGKKSFGTAYAKAKGRS